VIVFRYRVVVVDDDDDDDDMLTSTELMTVIDVHMIVVIMTDLSLRS
jgi:hypothetical protein